MMHVAKKDGRISHPVILEIDLNLIFLNPTKYTTQNAAKNGVFADGSIDAFKQINFNLFNKNYFDLTDDDKSYYQAEVLVLRHVPTESIMNINSF